MKASLTSTSTPLLYWSSLKNGEAPALKSLYNLYANVLYNYGSKFSTDQDVIKDCIQELFITLWTRKEHLSEPANVKNYLFKAFRLALFKKGKILQNQISYEETEHYPFQASITIEQEIIDGESNLAIKEKLEATLQKLSARQREAIFLKFYEGQSYEEIAEIMDISVKGAYKVMARAMDSLRDQLSKEDFFLLLFLLSTKTMHL